MDLRNTTTEDLNQPDLPTAKSNLPQFGSSYDYLFIDAHMGVISVKIEIVAKILTKNSAESYGGKCGYCGDRSTVSRFETDDYSSVFINLCPLCEDTLRNDIEELIEEKPEDIVTNLL